MLKLRNAVLTALLAFCLAMPFVSCSFNDGATGDVSNLVTEQTGNNQNGGNGGSTGGSGTNSGEDEDHDHDNNGGNENQSGGNNGGSGKPGEGTTYVVIYNGKIIEESLPESKWSYGVEKVKLEEGADYTMKGNEITLTDSGYQKVLPLLGDSGGDGGQEVIPPVTDGPVTDGPVPDVPEPDVPGFGDEPMYTVTVAGEPLRDKNGEVVTIPAAALSAYAQTYGLVAGDDYTIDGDVITLTDSGYNKVTSDMPPVPVEG